MVKTILVIAVAALGSMVALQQSVAHAAPIYKPEVCSFTSKLERIRSYERAAAEFKNIDNKYSVGIRTNPEKGLTPLLSVQAIIDLKGEASLCSKGSIGTITWGDGTAEKVTVGTSCGPAVSRTISHTYSKAGTYHITFTSFEGMPVGRTVYVGRAEQPFALCTKDTQGRASLEVSLQNLPKGTRPPKRATLMLYENESNSLEKKVTLKNGRATVRKLDFGETYYATLSVDGFKKSEALVLLEEWKNELDFSFKSLVRE